MRASVCRWNLRAEFLTKKQCEQFIIAYMKSEDIPLSFNYCQEMTETSEVHVLEIEGTWATNLSRVSKLLEEVDHRVNRCD